mmetsp:Transcript_32048/g.52926  ORF Transcript_32048/g.52926 Transcript_32048/m.52926 type:complete len:138 (-) Transcript_32048:1667-2080(-)
MLPRHLGQMHGIGSAAASTRHHFNACRSDGARSMPCACQTGWHKGARLIIMRIFVMPIHLVCIIVMVVGVIFTIVLVMVSGLIIVPLVVKCFVIVSSIMVPVVTIVLSVLVVAIVVCVFVLFGGFNAVTLEPLSQLL